MTDEKRPTCRESENPASTPRAQGGRPRTNQDWWPNQLDL